MSDPQPFILLEALTANARCDNPFGMRRERKQFNIPASRQKGGPPPN
jgi:hypothetical protein